MNIDQECRDAEEAKFERRSEVFNHYCCPYCGWIDGLDEEGEACGYCAKGRARSKEEQDE